MEDEELKRKLEQLKAVTGAITASLSSAPISFKKCDHIYRSCLGDPKDNVLPIYLGVTDSTGEYLFSIGNMTPLVLKQDELFYLCDSVLSLTKHVNKELFGMNEPGFEKKFKKVRKDLGELSIGTGVNLEPSIVTDELKKSLGIDTPKQEPVPESEISSEDTIVVNDNEGNEVKLEDLLSKVKTLNEAISDTETSEEEIKKYTDQIKDIQDILGKLTPEQKEELSKVQQKLREKNILEKSKNFEKQLLGEIEIEPAITYNYDHFRDIFNKEGHQALKEELAKLPKEEKDKMIKLIVEEYKIK